MWLWLPFPLTLSNEFSPFFFFTKINTAKPGFMFNFKLILNFVESHLKPFSSWLLTTIVGAGL
jgi:hypothetical protein